MHNSTKIFRLEGKVQHYAWGGTDFIPHLLHYPNPGKAPFAEYWMGAHINLPSDIIIPGKGKQPLNEFIKSDPSGILGLPASNRFGRLPYLFKVLDVKNMLSIQVHPAKKAAEKSFDAENKKGVPLDALTRNYKDDNHKPELMYALGDFWLLHGFKSPPALKALLQQIPELHFLLPVFNNDNYFALYQTVMTIDAEKVNSHLQPLLNRIVPLYNKGLLMKNQEDFWAARAASLFCDNGQVDRGIFSVYFFNLVNLKAGEAIFQDAGIPHAYLEGQNMELMANSDNVLRGGLTNKYIDVNELIKHTKFVPVTPAIIIGRPGTVPQEKIFPTPAADFEFHEIVADDSAPVTLTSVSADIFFVYTGQVLINSGHEKLQLKSGEAFLVTAGARVTLVTEQTSRVFRASVPLIGL